MPHSPSLRAHIFPYGVLLFCFFLPLWPRLASWLAALVFLVWLFQSSWSRLARPVVLLAPALFFWYLIGVFYSDNQMAGWQVLETKLPLLAFPLILIGSPPGRLQTGQWLRAFAAGCFAAVIISLGLAVWTYFDSGTSHFFYSKLGGFLGFHPTYFSMYISMALFAIVWETASWNRRKIALVLFFLFFF